MANIDVQAAAKPLDAWATWTFLAGIGLLGLGTSLAILAVAVPALLIPGVILLDAALTLLAVSGILRVLPG